MGRERDESLKLESFSSQAQLPAALGLGMFRQACHGLSRIIDGNSRMF
jgi:hypothetical protein